MKIPFSPPDISQLEIDNVVDVLKSGWITTGPRTKELEKRVAEYCGTQKAVCLNSQTASSEMTLRLLGVGPGDEVITSAYTYTATASIVQHVGAKLVLIDTQTDSLEMDYEKLENAITDKTKVVIPVDLAGIPCDYKTIFEILNRKKNLFTASNEIQKNFGRIILMADNAHSFGSFRYGKPTGSIADFSTFSFHAVKNFTTAEGGAVTWRRRPGISDEYIYKQYQLLSLHGQSKDALEKNNIGSWEYDIVDTNYKCNMTDVMAAIGLGQMERYEELLNKRKTIIEKYDFHFNKAGINTLSHYTNEYQSSGHLYITRIPHINFEQRNEIIVKMAKKGIVCNVHYKPLPLLTAYKKIGFDISDFPNAYNQFVNEITLPLHTLLTEKEIDYIIFNYLEIVKNYINSNSNQN